MHAPHSPQSQAESQDIALSQSDPYRTPSEVPGEAKRGWLKSPLTWIVVAGLLAGTIVMLAAIRSTGVSDHVMNFGITRQGPPPEPEEIAEYEVSMASEE